MEVILKVTDLKKTFPMSRKQRKLEKTDAKLKVAVDGLSFEAYKGEIFGLLGPNGAGKTTTLRILATLIHADEGSVSINGHDVKTEPDKVRCDIGFLTSELKLEEFFTPDYLFDFFAYLHGISGADCVARKRRLFERFGIDKFAHVKVANLSTGMKQKVSIAVSIAHDPEIIIFDEPTNGLDVITSKVVTDFLIDLKNEGKTVILSTHIFSLAEKLCDRVGIIINGKMTECDAISALCKDVDLESRFFEIYERVTGGAE